MSLPPPSPPPDEPVGRPWSPVVLGALLLLTWWSIYGRYLPGPEGRLGHDWAQHLPNLLNGVYAWLGAGLFPPPWFTPAQCGGIPFYADPNVGFYSVPQYLALLVGPLRAAQLSFVGFAAAGLWGTWQLNRRAFGLGVWPSLFGATLVLFNGYFTHRMLIGHLTFHAFMVVPVAAWALLTPARTRRGRLLAGATFAACLGYLSHAGMVHGLLPTALCLAILLVLHRLLRGGPWPWARLVGGGVLGAALGASKIGAGLAWLASYPRDQYRLPGFDGVGAALLSSIDVLFFDGAARVAELGLVGSSWKMGRHELEYGLGWCALVPMVLWALRRRPAEAPPAPHRPLLLVTFTLLMLVPLALNVWSPGWNALLKSLPILKSSSSLLRFMSAWILPVAVLSAYTLDHTRLDTRPRTLLAVVLMLLTAGTQSAVDRTYYASQPYVADRITNAWERAMVEGFPPIVKFIEATEDGEGGYKISLHGNESLVHGGSQIACYQAIFGYTLEDFPLEPLRPGLIFRPVDGRLNLKNPACYLFPAENGCKPGDHYRVDQEPQAARLTEYLQPEFNRSTRQVILDVVNLLAVVLTLGALPLALLREPGD